MKTLILFVCLFSSLTSLTASASNCTCTTSPFTKTYAPNGIQNKWWGGKRIWSCLYKCENSSTGVTGEIRGQHKATYYGEDDGLWGICEGLTYKNEYSTYKERFIWTFDSISSFDPVRSKSPEVKSWAKQNCQR